MRYGIPALTVATALIAGGCTYSEEVNFAPEVVAIDLEEVATPPSDFLLESIFENTVQIIQLSEEPVSGDEDTTSPRYVRGSGVLIDDNIMVTAGHAFFGNETIAPVSCSELEAWVLLNPMVNSNSVGRQLESGLSILSRTEDPLTASARDLGVFTLSDSVHTLTNEIDPVISTAPLKPGQVLVLADYQYELAEDSRFTGIRLPSVYSGVVAKVPASSEEAVPIITGLNDLETGTDSTTSNPGSSGGPVYDRETGDLVGITIGTYTDFDTGAVIHDINNIETVFNIDIRIENDELKKAGIAFIVPVTSDAFTETVAMVAAGGGESCN